MYQLLTLHKREPTRIQDLTVSQISQIKRAQMFRVPTAFDRYHPSQHWAAEYEGYGPEEYRDRIANLASSIHTEGIQSQMKDNLLLTYLSGVYTGGNKKYKYCRRCISGLPSPYNDEKSG